MRSQHLRLAAAAAGVIAAAALAACGSTAGPSGTSGTPSPSVSTPAATTQFNAADVAFTTGMLRLESQAQAMAGLVVDHTTNTQVRQFAATVRSHDGDAQHMRDMMSQWHQPTPAPYTPGATSPAGMGPGMMSGHDWNEMLGEHGSEFTDHWLDAMIANRTAQTALCRSELRAGASPQARALAQSMLTQRQAELAHLQRMHHDQEHNSDHD